MYKFKTIIVDDEEEARQLLTFLLTDFREIDLRGEASCVDDAVTLFIEHKPDIVFLDIEMPQKNGFDFIREIRDFDIHPTVIFVTAFNKYAIEAIKHAAFDYLLKPVSNSDLARTIERFKTGRREKHLSRQAEILFSNLPHKKVKLKTVNGFVLIIPDEVAYCIAEGNYTNIFLISSEKIFISAYLSEVEEALSSKVFFRINRSVLLNINLLQRVNRRNKKCEIKVKDKKIHFVISKRAIDELEKDFPDVV